MSDESYGDDGLRAASTFQRGLDRSMAVAADEVPLHITGSTLGSLLARVEEVIDYETTALRNRLPIDFAEVSRRKSRSLLELTRVARTLQGEADERTVSELARLRAKLIANRNLLGIHLAAAQEVAGLLSRAAEEADSDGTYSTRSGNLVPRR